MKKWKQSARESSVIYSANDLKVLKILYVLTQRLDCLLCSGVHQTYSYNTVARTILLLSIHSRMQIVPADNTKFIRE